VILGVLKIHFNWTNNVSLKISFSSLQRYSHQSFWTVLVDDRLTNVVSFCTHLVNITGFSCFCCKVVTPTRVRKYNVHLNMLYGKFSWNVYSKHIAAESIYWQRNMKYGIPFKGISMVTVLVSFAVNPLAFLAQCPYRVVRNSIRSQALEMQSSTPERIWLEKWRF